MRIYCSICATILADLSDMSFLDCLDSTPTGDIQREDTSASKKFPIPDIKFSQATYQIGLWSDDLAKKLHESKYLYATYGALDGLSNICSHWRFLFDLIYSSSDITSDDKLHEFLSSPEGMAIVGIETLAVMAWATIGNYFNSQGNHPIINYLALTWPYLRDCFKGSKNAFKGIRAALNIASFLSGTSLIPYVLPSAIGLGFFSVVNRLLMRYLYNQRKTMMKHNKQVWLDIQNLKVKDFSPEALTSEGQAILKTLQEHSDRTRTLALLGAAYGGFVDGLYMYVGIVTLLGVSGMLWLTSPVALFLIGCSVLYGLTNIAVRINEEHGYQKKIDISVAKANLAFTGKKIACLYRNLRKTNEQQLSKQHFTQLSEYIGLYKQQRERLEKLSNLSYKSAFLLGITHGLAAYGALASFIFAVSTITFLIMQTIPPVLLITVAVTIASGLLCMALFAANAVYRNYQHRQNADGAKMLHKTFYLKELEKLKEVVKGEVIANKPDDEIEALIANDCMVIDSQPLFFYMELFEIVRSFFSGVGKGPKSMMTTFNAFQEKGDDGHYHFDSWILLAFTSVSSFVYAVCLALRAYARGFGRPPIDHIETNDQTDHSPSQSPSLNTPKPKATIKRSQSSSDFSIFKKPPSESSVPRNNSDQHLSKSLPNMSPQNTPTQPSTC